MGAGNGAHVVHQMLDRCIPEYALLSYHPAWALLPLALLFVARPRGARLIHTVPDYAFFHCRVITPLIISFQNYVLDHEMRAHSTWAQRLHYATDLRLWTALAVKRAQQITAVSDYTARLISTDMHVPTPIQIIYNGVDTDLFTPGSRRTNSPGPLRVFFSGNLTRRKGAHWLPGIAKRLNNNIKIFYTQGLGTGKRKPFNSSNLQPIGSIPWDHMAGLYPQMDVLLMPTVREGFSLSILEAMSCGLPVVASNCSSLPEQIHDSKGGYLCPVGDTRAFAEKLNFLADSPVLRKEMGEYNRFRVEKKFTLRQMIQSYRRLFDTLLSRQPI